MLASVPQELWETNRYPPVPEAVTSGPPIDTPVDFTNLALNNLSQSTRNATLWLFKHRKDEMYAPGPRPSVRILGADLEAQLVNLPDAERLEDLVLDLGSILKEVSRQDRYISP